MINEAGRQPATTFSIHPDLPMLSSIFRQKSAAPSTSRTLAWRKNDFLAYAVGQDEQTAMLRGRAPLVLPGFVVDFINSCENFASLESHLAKYADKHAWGELECDTLRSWLPKVTGAGLLISAKDVLETCQKSTDGHAPATITTIGFPTGGDRVDLVERALRSFASNAARHQRPVDFLIADSSSKPAHRTAFRERLATVGRELGVAIRYSGEVERRLFAGELIRRGADADAVEFALFDPLGVGFTCGANRNALLLDQVGRAFFSVDDDVTCELAAAPATEFRLRAFSQCDPYARWLFADRESALQHAPSVDADFIGSHEAMLGHSLGALTSGLSVEQFDVSQATDDFVRRAAKCNGRVRATFSAHLGDPGIPTSVYFLYFEGENRRRLTASEAHYRAVLASRNVFVVSPSAGVGDSSTSPGMAMGLDHRELLPPFFPVLHAEDFVFGAALWQTIGNAFLAHTPLAVRHEPRPGKGILQPGDLGGENRAVIFEFAHLMRRVILRFMRGDSSTPAARMKALGESLAAAGEQPLGDFLDFIHAHVLEHESGKLDHLETELREDTESPDFWREDVEAYIAHVREALTHDDFDIPFDLKGDRSDEANRVLMRELFIRYGRLLQAWPKIVDIAREVHASGFESTLKLS
jgi:hypothetical protein